MCGTSGTPPSTAGGYIMNPEFPGTVPNTGRNCSCTFERAEISSTAESSKSEIEICLWIIYAELRGDTNLPPCHEKLTTYSSAFILNSRCNDHTYIDQWFFQRTLSSHGDSVDGHSVAFIRQNHSSASQGRILLSYTSKQEKFNYILCQILYMT